MKEQLIIDFLNKKYPQSKAEEWDFVGYSIKQNNNGVKKILICLDVNKLSIEQAIKSKVNLIISFHPFCFDSSWKEVYKYDPTKKEQVELLKKNKISVFSIHTNFDKNKFGTKYWFNKKLNLENKIIKSFDYATIAEYNDTFISLINLLKNKLEINVILTNWANKENQKIKNIYIQPGAGDVYDFLKKTKTNSIDLLITSDIKWNEQQLLNSIGIKFVIIPHKTEDVFVNAVKNLLIEKFQELEIIEFISNDFIKGY